MGNSSKEPADYEMVNTYKVEDWEVLEDLGYCTLWRHRGSGLLVEAYKLLSEPDINDLDRYEFRYQNDENIIAVHHVVLNTNTTICNSNHAESYVLVEHIPYRLSDLRQLHVTETLTILKVTYSAFNTIASFYGSVEPNEDMIGFTSDARVKVWLNSNIASNMPERLIDGGNSQQNNRQRNTDYVRKILEMVEQRTINRTLPSELKRKFYREDLNYFEAHNLIEEFAESMNMPIPYRIMNENLYQCKMNKSQRSLVDNVMKTPENKDEEQKLHSMNNNILQNQHKNKFMELKPNPNATNQYYSSSIKHQIHFKHVNGNLSPANLSNKPSLTNITNAYFNYEKPTNFNHEKPTNFNHEKPTNFNHLKPTNSPTTFQNCLRQQSYPIIIKVPTPPNSIYPNKPVFIEQSQIIHRKESKNNEQETHNNMQQLRNTLQTPSEPETIQKENKESEVNNYREIEEQKILIKNEEINSEKNELQQSYEELSLENQQLSDSNNQLLLAEENIIRLEEEEVHHQEIEQVEEYKQPRLLDELNTNKEPLESSDKEKEIEEKQSEEEEQQQQSEEEEQQQQSEEEEQYNQSNHQEEYYENKETIDKNENVEPYNHEEFRREEYRNMKTLMNEQCDQRESINFNKTISVSESRNLNDNEVVQPQEKTIESVEQEEFVQNEHHDTSKGETYVQVESKFDVLDAEEVNNNAGDNLEDLESYIRKKYSNYIESGTIDTKQELVRDESRHSITKQKEQAQISTYTENAGQMRVADEISRTIISEIDYLDVKNMEINLDKKYSQQELSENKKKNYNKDIMDVAQLEKNLQKFENKKTMIEGSESNNYNKEWTKKQTFNTIIETKKSQVSYKEYNLYEDKAYGKNHEEEEQPSEEEYSTRKKPDRPLKSYGMVSSIEDKYNQYIRKNEGREEYLTKYKNSSSRINNTCEIIGEGEVVPKFSFNNESTYNNEKVVNYKLRENRPKAGEHTSVSSVSYQDLRLYLES